MIKEKAELSVEPITRTGITREAVRQQQQKALRNARKIMRSKGLKAEDFFETTRRTNKC